MYKLCIFCKTTLIKNKEKQCELCCNISKYIDKETFILLCANICNKKTIYNIRILNQTMDNLIPVNYYQFKFNNYLDDINSNILEEDYYNLINKPCSICNKHKIQNTFYFEVNNYYSICVECRFLKMNYKYDDFDIQIKKIYECNKNNIDKIYKSYLKNNKIVRFVPISMTMAIGFLI